MNYRFSDNDIKNETDTKAGAKTFIQTIFNLPAFKLLMDNRKLEEYGEMLTKSLFADSNLRSAFTKASTSAATVGKNLRVRLNIHPSAMKLYALCWGVSLSNLTMSH